MSTAAEKAQARRKAILARGSDRLAKLSTSARGEDAAPIHDDPIVGGRSAGLNAFVGEDAPPLPKPSFATSTASSTASAPSDRSRAASSTASSTVGGSIAAEDPSAWSQVQQEQFMRALMGAGLGGGAGSEPTTGTPRIGNGTTQPPVDPASAMAEDPMAQLMASLMGGGMPGMGMNGAPPGASPFGAPGTPGSMPAFPNMMNMAPPAPPKPKTLVQKLLPLFHLFATFALLVYFVLWMEPNAHGEAEAGGVWTRWSELRSVSSPFGWSLKTVPFFPAFVTLEIVLQSIRMATGWDNTQLSGLLALAVPSLPPPIPALIRNGFKYSQILTVLLDDVSGVIVALGVIVWTSGMISR